MADSFKLPNKPGLTREEARRMWALCEECATKVWNAAPPKPEYVTVITEQLFGTGAQESGYEWRKQMTVPFTSYVGGFSFWQVEKGSVLTSLKMLTGYPRLAQNAAEFLFGDNIHNDIPLQWAKAFAGDPSALLFSMLMEDNDRIGVLFSRLHYMRVNAAIPPGVREQAAYWKQHYNTPAGKGTVEQYIQNWQKYYPLTLDETPVIEQPPAVVQMPATERKDPDLPEILEEMAASLNNLLQSVLEARKGAPQAAAS